MIGQTVSHYRILNKLGEGGMGVVYACEDTVLRRRVAVKMMTAAAEKQHYRTRFLREAQSASALSHPNIAAIYDYGETPEGMPFIVMELVEGQTLDELMRGGGLTLSRAVEIAEAVAGALAEAHRLNIVHRDIKPSNVAVGTRGDVKVLDFGLSKQLNDESPGADAPEAQALAATQTREGVIVGTPLYLSPEQALSMKVDARSDIFSLGSLLYECVAGCPAFAGKGAIEICAKVIRDDPEPPSRHNALVPAELDRVILKALSKRPEGRYQSAAEMLSDLNAARAFVSGEAAAPDRRPPSPVVHRTSGNLSVSRIIRRPRTLVATFITALAIGVAAWLVQAWRPAAPLWNSREAQRRFDEGVSALHEGTYNKARKLFEDSISIESKAPLAHAGLARALVELDDALKAEREITLARALASERGGLPAPNQLFLDATAETIGGDLGGAVDKYEQILRLTPDDDGPAKSRAHVELGRAWEKRGDRSKALENYQAAASRDPQSAAVFLRLGILHGLMSTEESAAAAGQARGEFEKAESLYETSSNAEGVTEVLLRRGAFLASLGGNGSEARAQLIKARDLARAPTGNMNQEIRALLSLSSVAATEGKTDEAKGYANEAVDSARIAGMESLTAQGLIDLGNAFLLRREYGDAEAYMKQALDLAQRYGEDFDAAKARLFLAKLYVQVERLDEGLAYARQSLDFYRGTGYGRETTEALLLDGRARLLKGDYEKALASFDRAFELAAQIQDAAQVGRSHTEVGFWLASREQYPAALHHYDESYEINRSLDDPRRTAYSLLARGDMLWRLGRYEESATALSQASVVAERLKDEYRQLFLARIFLVDARLELSRRNIAEAVKKAELAQAQAGTKIQYAAIEVRYTLGLARVLSGGGSAGVGTCREAVAEARKASFSEPPLIGGALLALAEAEFEAGDAQGSLRDALEAQDMFARDGQQESEWRSHLMAARSLERLRQPEEARAHLARGDELLLALQRNWGAESFYGYIARPDLRAARDRLTAALAAQ